MAIAPKILFGHVMHKRLFPKVNLFIYKIYYLVFALSIRSKLPLSYNKAGLISFYDRDHGDRDGSGLEVWCRGILAKHGVIEADGEIHLICMPRVLGYVFNPISFWMCLDKTGNLRTVLCEVNNTFGEQHIYICKQQDHSPIEREHVLKAEKLFHVSPLLKREGHYTFRFDWQKDSFAARINYYNGKCKKQLLTSVKGHLQPMNVKTMRKAFFGYPLITIKAITLIHWQALKMLIKGINYKRKPKQKKQHISTAQHLTKT